MTVLTSVRAPRTPVLRERIFSFPAFLACLVGFCVLLLVPNAIEDPDIWWHLRNAEWQIHAHSWLRQDLYAFTTRGAPWMNHEWLAELPFYLGWRLLGAEGLLLVTVMAVECIFLGVFYLAWRHSGEIKAALPVSLIAAVLSTISFGPRTLLFGWVALVAELLILQSFVDRGAAEQRRARWLLPCLFALWVNTHGSWLIGIVVLVAFVGCGWFPLHRGAVQSAGWTREQKGILTSATAISLASLFLNPYGWRLVFYPFDLAFRQKLNITNVEEWATLDFHSPRGHILLLALGLLFFAQLVRRRVWAPYELAYLAIGVYASFTYSRFLFLAAILICPLLAKDLPGLAPYRAEKNKPWLNAAMLGALLPFAVHHLRTPVTTPAEGRAFPDQALPFLQNFHPQGNVFNDLLFGGYLEWHTRQIPTFVDTRIDIFEYSGVFKDYLDAMRLKNTLPILDKYRIRYVLFQPDTPLVYLLEQTRKWKIDYQDRSTILLERIAPLPQ